MAPALVYAPASVLATYKATPALPALQGSTYWVSQGNTAILLPQSYNYDVFLDAYTAGINEPVATSLHKAATYLQVRIKAGPLEVLGGVGAVLAIISFFDPTAWQDIQNLVKSWFTCTTDSDCDINDLPIPDPTLSDPFVQPVPTDLSEFPGFDSEFDNYSSCIQGVTC